MKPTLYVVGSRKQAAAKASPFDDMAKLRASNQAASAVLAGKEPAPRKASPKKRLWAPTYLDEMAGFQLPPAYRLLCVLRCRSFRGRKKLVLTAEIATEAGIDPRKRSRYAKVLEKLGAVQVGRDGQHTLTVTVLR